MMENESDCFSIHTLACDKLNKTKPSTKQNIIEGVSFFSHAIIQKEWEIIRNQ